MNVCINICLSKRKTICAKLCGMRGNDSAASAVALFFPRSIISLYRFPHDMSKDEKKTHTHHPTNQSNFSIFIHECSSECGFVLSFYSSSKSLLANVLDIDDDFRCNHSCPTFLQQPTYYRTVYRYLKVIFIMIYLKVKDAVEFIELLSGQSSPG